MSTNESESLESSKVSIITPSGPSAPRINSSKNSNTHNKVPSSPLSSDLSEGDDDYIKKEPRETGDDDADADDDAEGEVDEDVDVEGEGEIKFHPAPGQGEGESDLSDVDGADAEEPGDATGEPQGNPAQEEPEEGELGDDDDEDEEIEEAEEDEEEDEDGKRRSRFSLSLASKKSAVDSDNERKNQDASGERAEGDDQDAEGEADDGHDSESSITSSTEPLDERDRDTQEDDKEHGAQDLTDAERRRESRIAAQESEKTSTKIEAGLMNLDDDGSELTTDADDDDDRGKEDGDDEEEEEEEDEDEDEEEDGDGDDEDEGEVREDEDEEAKE